MRQIPDYLTVTEAAAVLQVSRNTVYDWVKPQPETGQPILRSRIIGRKKIRIPASEIVRMLEPEPEPQVEA